MLPKFHYMFCQQHFVFRGFVIRITADIKNYTLTLATCPFFDTLFLVYIQTVSFDSPCAHRKAAGPFSRFIYFTDPLSFYTFFGIAQCIFMILTCIIPQVLHKKTSHTECPIGNTLWLVQDSMSNRFMSIESTDIASFPI